MTAIEADLARLSADELERRLGAQADTFARLSRDVASRLDIAGREVVDPERERAAVLGVLHGYLARAADARPLLFVIEDLHWASSGTRDAIGHISRLGGDAALMLLVTTRDAPPHVPAELAAFLGLLAGLPSVKMIALAGLDVAAAASMIDAVGGNLDPAQGVRLTGGNPLFLREVIREGPASPTLDLDVVDVAAAAGDQIDVSLIASALDRSSADVLDSLERSEAAGLVGPGAGPGRFAFIHDVFRSVRYASLTASRRLRMHAALAQALSGRAVGETVSAELARHACLAGPRFDPAVAADLAAGRQRRRGCHRPRRGCDALPPCARGARHRAWGRRQRPPRSADPSRRLAHPPRRRRRTDDAANSSPECSSSGRPRRPRQSTLRDGAAAGRNHLELSRRSTAQIARRNRSRDASGS